MAREVQTGKGKDKRQRMPKVTFASIIILGLIVWTAWAYVQQSQLIWIPEASFWYRLGVLMERDWYIPLIFVIAAVGAFFFLERKHGKKSAG